MSRGKNFIGRETFEQLLGQIDSVYGTRYQDFQTIYGDLSRLVVAIIASMSPAELQEVYTKLGWGGNASTRAMHEVAKQWYSTYHPCRLPSRKDAAQPIIPLDLTQKPAQGR